MNVVEELILNFRRGPRISHVSHATDVRGLPCLASVWLLETLQLSSKPAPGPQMARNGRSSLPRSRRMLEMAARACPGATECSKTCARACPGAADCSKSAARACPGTAACSNSAPRAHSEAASCSNSPLPPSRPPPSTSACHLRLLSHHTLLHSYHPLTPPHPSPPPLHTYDRMRLDSFWVLFAVCSFLL